MRSIGQNPTEDEILNHIVEYDINGDGTIDFDEFCEMMLKQSKDIDQTVEIVSQNSSKSIIPSPLMSYSTI